MTQMTVSTDSRKTVADIPKRDHKRAILEAGSGYLWFFAAIAAFNPYVAMFYRSHGFTGLQVGILVAMPAVGIAMSGAFWGSVMDQLGIHRWVLWGALVMTAVSAVLVANANDFTTMFVFVTMLAFSMTPLRSLLDSYAVSVSERTRSSFGSLRAWGSVGYFLAVQVLGELMKDKVSNLFLYAFALFLVLTLISMLPLPNLSARRPANLTDGLKDVVTNKALGLLFFTAFLLAIAFATIYVGLGLHIKSLGGNTGIVGTAFAVGAVAEAPAFLLGAKVIRKIGERRLIIFAIAMYALRFFLYYVIDDPWLIVPTQAFHMITFASFLVASVPLAHKLDGGKHPATTQALLTMVSFGFGNIAGSVLGGWMLDVMGTANLFFSVSILMVITLVIFVIGSKMIDLDARVKEANLAMRH